MWVTNFAVKSVCGVPRGPYAAAKWLSFHLNPCHVVVFLPKLKVNSRLTLSGEPQFNRTDKADGRAGGVPARYDNLVYRSPALKTASRSCELVFELLDGVPRL